MEFRLGIVGIASVQKTCLVDLKVLDPGLWEISSLQMGLIQGRGTCATEDSRCGCITDGPHFPKGGPAYRNGLFIDEGSLPCWEERATFDLMACAGGRVTFDPFDPIQAPAPRKPWLCSVDESGSRYGSDLVAGRHGPGIGQPP